MAIYQLAVSVFVLSLSSVSFSIDRQTLLEEAGLDIMCDTESYTSCMDIETQACKSRLDRCAQAVPDSIEETEIGDAYFQIEQCFLDGFDIPEEKVDRCEERFIDHLDALESE